MPEVFTTAHDALFTQAGLAMGERVCVHGAAGGVGSAGVQLAIAAGATVVATVRDPARRADVAALGATVIEPEGFGDHGPFDVILELVGGPNLDADVKALATGGRVVVIGVGAGAKAEINLLALMGARGRILASTLRARPLEGKAAAARAVEHHVLPLFEAGTLTVPVHQAHPMSTAPAAYEQFAAGRQVRQDRPHQRGLSPGPISVVRGRRRAACRLRPPLRRFGRAPSSHPARGR